MALITLSQVRKSFGAFQVVDEASFTVGNGEKVALVGPNGSGKTTLLRMIAGLEEPESGQVVVLPGSSVGYMRQDDELHGGSTLLDEVAGASVEIQHLERELRRLEAAMSADGAEMEELVAEYGEVQHEFERLGGYSFEAELKSALAGLGLGPEHWEKPVEVLSGGQKTRAALAKLLLKKPDVLLLDEPTNHLDIDATEWLEEFLQGFPGAVLIVSHDRYFLDRVVTKVVDLHDGCTRSYPGNYTAFVKQKSELLRQQMEGFERQQEEVAKLEDFIARYRAGQRAREAKSRGKRLAKMVRIAKPRTESQKMRLSLSPAMQSGHIVMDLVGVAKSFGGRALFSGLDMLVESGDRIGVVGPNGSGKSTLLRMIVGDEELSAGTISTGYAVEIGYFAQDLSDLDPDNSVLEELLEAGDMTSGEARSLLARFLFIGEDVFKKVGRLSGGEKNRLVLAKLMLSRPNVLVLDEPTNHLDIDSRQALDAALSEFPGTVIVTSHDRYLLNSIATRILEISGGASRLYAGNYDYFQERRVRARPTKRKKAPPRPRRAKAPKPAEIEWEIEVAEARLAELAEILGRSETYSDPTSAAESVAEYEGLQTKIEELYADWVSGQ
ncbi:MAG: ABC-F family ATP-binding cassette domain-containing protein [Armatimonadota bacterium]